MLVESDVKRDKILLENVYVPSCANEKQSNVWNSIIKTGTRAVGQGSAKGKERNPNFRTAQ